MSLPPAEERRLGEVHLPGDVLHPYAFAIFAEEADSGWITGERAIREGVDVKEGSAHDSLLAHQPAASKSHPSKNGLTRPACRRRFLSEPRSGFGGQSSGGRVLIRRRLTQSFSRYRTEARQIPCIAEISR